MKAQKTLPKFTKKREQSMKTVKTASLEAFKENNETRKIDTSKRVRIGIIGIGWIAESHLSSILRQPDIDLLAGADSQFTFLV